MRRNPDLESRADIHDLFVGFYRGIVFDELLAPVFGDGLVKYAQN